MAMTVGHDMATLMAIMARAGFLLAQRFQRGLP
jgi:hypothetical protein